MLKDKDLETAVDAILERFEEINLYFIKQVAEQIRQIGELTQSSINRLTIMAELRSDVKSITSALSNAAKLSTKDVQRLYRKAAEETYTDSRFTAAYVDDKPPIEAQERIERLTQSISEQTADAMTNISNTTAVSDAYKSAVDDAVLSVASGLTDYKAATRRAVQRIGYNGLQVQYESGYHRRLDTALRQNIIDGANQISQQSAKIIGEELGYNAYEISAHANSAPDHEPVQGHIFLLTEFEKIQSGQNFVDVNGISYAGFPRKIGEWNCGHMALPFDTRYSVPAYTAEQLQEWAKLNRKGCDIDGRHYSNYEASQLMRKIETEIRRQKDTAVAAQTAGDDVLRRNCQRKINSLSAKYSQIAKLSGLPTKRQRMTVEGFKAVKLN